MCAVENLRFTIGYGFRWEFALPEQMREEGYPRERWSMNNWSVYRDEHMPYPSWRTSGMSRAKRKAWKARLEMASASYRHLEAKAAAAYGLEAPRELSKTRARLLRATDPRYVRRGRDEDPVAQRRRDRQHMSKHRRRMRQLGFPSRYDGSWPARRSKKAQTQSS